MKIIAPVRSCLGSLGRRKLAWFGILSIAALAVRFGCAQYIGSEYDMGAFSNWAIGSRSFAFLGYYSFFDHPHLSFPNYALYFPILALMGNAAQVTTAAGRILLKTPGMLGDIFLAGIVFCAAKPRWRMPAAAFVLFNPAIWYDSTIFGQTDSLHTAFMVLAVLCAAKNKYRFAWMSLAAAVFFKLQAIAILPLIVALNFKASGFKKMTVELAPAAILTAIMTLPYAIVSSPAIIWRSFKGSFGMFPLVAINAWNPWYLFHMLAGRWVYDTETAFGISYKTIGLIAFALAAAAIVYALPKRPGRMIIFAAAAAMSLAFFMLPTEMHERYAYSFIPLVAVLLSESPLVVCLAAAASLAIFLDMNFVQKMPILDLSFVNTVNGRAAWSVIFVATFVAYSVWYFRRARAEKQGKTAPGTTRLMAK